MSNAASKSNGKMQTVSDFEDFATKIDDNLEIIDNNFVRKVLRILSSIMTKAQRKEDGVFDVILKWFRLYLKLHSRINPDNKKLLKYYENSAPTIISYIIGCLQYKAKDMPNYHYNLLEILEELLENTQPSVLKKLNNFKIGTIGCLWNPIDLVGDFNTQSKVLHILSLLLKQFNEERQNEEIKSIKWTNLNLFQHKLKAVVKDTTLPHVLENSSRDLLNNYNMNLSKKVLVYSFYCKSMLLGNKYKFYKPLRLEKFWVDFNHYPKTLSYSGRFKLNSNSKFDIINVTLNIQSIILEKNILEVYFNKPGEFSKYSEYFSNIKDNVIQFTLTQDEKNRLLKNNYVIEYFNSFRRSDTKHPTKTEMEDKSIFESLKNEMSKSLQENVKSTSNIASKLCKKSSNFNINSNPEQNVISKDPMTKLSHKKKFFKSLLTENSDEEPLSKKLQRKRTRNPKSRQTKSPSKQVCKVTPTVDLTKTECIDSVEKTTNKSCVKKIPKEKTSETGDPPLTTASCNKVLKQVSDIYDTGDTTYARPCQSYRNFEIQLFPKKKLSKNNESYKENNSKKNFKLENECSIAKKRKTANCHSQTNKENLNPGTSHKDSKLGPLLMTANILSPYLFETQHSDENKNKLSKSMEIDLAIDQIEHTPITCEVNCDKDAINKENTFSSSSLDCEVRAMNEDYLQDIECICTPTNLINSSNLSTPRPTSAMNISNLTDSDIEVTQVYNGPIINMEKHIQKTTDANSLTLQANRLDMGLENLSNHTNFVVEQQFKNSSHKKANLQTNCQAIKKNIGTPVYLQQILNDFEYGSDEEFDVNYETPTKTSTCDVITQSDCGVLKDNSEAPVSLQGILNNICHISDNEFDPSYETPKTSFKKNVKHEINNNLAKPNYNRDCVIFQNRRDIDDPSSSDEDIDGEFQKGNNEWGKKILPVVENRQLFLNQHLLQGINMRATPDKNIRISTSMTSRAVKKCQVSPSAIIMQNFQVSAKKSMLIRSTKQTKILKANKCLKNMNNKTFNKKSAEPLQETFKLQRKNLNNIKKINWTQIPRKRSTYLKLVTLQEIPNDSENNYIFKNCCNEPSKETSASTIQQQTRSLYSNMTEENENDLFNCTTRNVLHQRTPLKKLNSLFKKDLLEIIDDYNTSIKQSVNNTLCLGLKNISDVYNRKYLEIAEVVLKKSNKNKMELDEIRSNISRLVRELELQYDAFMNKSQQFDIQKEMTERMLESILNTDVLTSITKNYEDVLNKLKVEQNEVFQKLWQRYLERHRL